MTRNKRDIGAGRITAHMLAVYRYYCHNPACVKKSFTAFPPGVLPYTAERLETHVLVLQMYAWGRSVYRRTGTAMGVATMTAYRWVSAFGAELLPVAVLFGVVRSSGVGGDETDGATAI